MDGLKGKSVLVTGGSSGIGQAIAIRFGLEGAHVAINYRSDKDEAADTRAIIERAVEECTETMRAQGERPILVGADVSDPVQVKEMVDTVVREFGGLDILVNNAGIQSESPSHDLDEAEFDRIIGVNLRGAFVCARESIRHFLESGNPGVILNVSSVHEVIPKPRYLAYSISKGGMANLTRTLALEYASKGIRVNAIGPGATVTPINSEWVDDPDKRSEIEEHIPMGRAGTAEEMAAAAAFLCSGETAYITGQTLYIDGGLTLYPNFREPLLSE